MTTTIVSSERPATEAIGAQASRITVIITCFNHAAFLGDAVGSVLRQTEPAAEIIVVDDGSTDDTATVAASYESVRYIRQHNQGPSAARNSGLRAASTPFIVFLDADDTLESTALAIGKTHLLAHPDWAFVSGGHRRVTSDHRPLGNEIRRVVHAGHFEALLRSNYIEMHATVMYRREALLRVGGFNEALRGTEDYDVYLRIAREFPVGSHAEVIASYRQHAANSSQNLDVMLSTVLRVIESQRPHISADRGRMAAWQDGRRKWIIYYGNQILKQTARHHTSLAANPERLRSLLTLLRQYPVLHSALRYVPRERISFVRPVRAQLRKVKLFVLRRLLRMGSFESNVVLGSATQPESVVARYIEKFLDKHRAEMDGAFEVGSSHDLVTQLPTASQKCVVCVPGLRTFDCDAAVADLQRVLRPGGTLLAVLPGVVMPFDATATNDFWRFTAEGARRLFGRHFGDDLEVAALGNPVTALAALHRLPASSLEDAEFMPVGSQHQLLITVRAVKR